MSPDNKGSTMLNPFLFCLSRNLYKHVKLLFLGGGAALGDIPLPSDDLGGPRVEHLGAAGEAMAAAARETNNNGGGMAGAAADWDVISNTNSRLSDHTPVFPTIAFLGMALVLVFIINHLYKSKAKPRRKKPRLRKMQNVVYGIRVPGV